MEEGGVMSIVQGGEILRRREKRYEVAFEGGAVDGKTVSARKGGANQILQGRGVGLEG